MIEFWLCFVPIFFAVDAFGVLPIFMGLIDGVDQKERRKIIWRSMITASFVAVGFLVIGKGVFRLLGITIADFMIAGGTLLFILAMREQIIFETRSRLQNLECPECIGAVPIGVPLIVGPAVLTTSIILLGEYGVVPTITAVLLNILLAGAVFSLSDPISRLLGTSGTRTISKIAGLIIAAIGVMMVRKGIMSYIGSGA